jgi:hypothetical protein
MITEKDKQEFAAKKEEAGCNIWTFIIIGIIVMILKGCIN